MEQDCSRPAVCGGGNNKWFGGPLLLWPEF